MQSNHTVDIIDIINYFPIKWVGHPLIRAVFTLSNTQISFRGAPVRACAEVGEAGFCRGFKEQSLEAANKDEPIETCLSDNRALATRGVFSDGFSVGF